MTINTGLIAALKAAAVPGAERTYMGMAIGQPAYPYLVINHIAGGDDNFTPRDSRNEVWQILAVTDNPLTAAAAMEAIRGALHLRPIVVAGWLCLDVQHELPVYQSDEVGGSIIYLWGGRYRVRLVKE